MSKRPYSQVSSSSSSFGSSRSQERQTGPYRPNPQYRISGRTLGTNRMHVARRRNPEATQTSTGLKTETIAACLEHGLCPFYNGKHGNCCVASRCHLKHQILYSTPASGDERIRQPRDDYNAVLDRNVQRTQEAIAKAQEDAAAEERRQEQLEQERKDRESTRAYRSTYKFAAGDTMYDLRFNAVAPRSFGKLDLDTGPSDTVEEENIRSH